MKHIGRIRRNLKQSISVVTRAEWNNLSNVSLTGEVDRFLAGIIGQKSWLSREILVDAIMIEANHQTLATQPHVTLNILPPGILGTYYLLDGSLRR